MIYPPKVFASSITGTILLFTTLLIFSSAANAQQSPQILVGPNVLVGRENDGTSWEHFVAADPTNPQNLFGTAIVTRTNHPIGGQESRGYLSRDGGYSWKTIIFPEVASTRGGDPLVAYGRTGTPLFITLIGGMYVWWSEDGGSTWGKPTYVYQVDHPQVVVDHTNGRFAGRVYINAMISSTMRNAAKLHSRGDYHIAMFRSEDDGRTWVGPVTVATNHDQPDRGLNAYQPLVFTDGDLFAPFVSFAFSEKAKNEAKRLKLPWYYYGFARSNEGGVIFAQHQSLKTQGGVEIKGNSRPFFAVDNSEGPFKDRAYVAFADKDVRIGDDGKVIYLDNADPKPARIFVSYSSDKGKTWSMPKMISSVTNGDQFDISIAVNNEGTVLVSYHDTRDTPPGKEEVLLNRYASVSVDGGETFFPARRITSEPSDPAALFSNLAGPYAHSFSIGFESAASRYADYQGIATDLNGVFHPFWSDGRTGMNQTWTVAVRVVRPDVQRTVKPPELIEADITSMLEISFDPLHQFPPAGTIELPIRLKNKSDKTIYGPIRAEAVPGYVKAFFKLDLLNSSDGKTLDYTAALGDSGALGPGAISEGVVWRMKAPTSHKEFPNFDLKITGRIERPKDAAKPTERKQ